MTIYRGQSLGTLLQQEGIVPPHCSNVELHVPATGAAFLRYDVFLDSAHIPGLQRALAALVADSAVPPQQV